MTRVASATLPVLGHVYALPVKLVVMTYKTSLSNCACIHTSLLILSVSPIGGLASRTTMAVINLVMEAMGTTRSASFASNSSEVLASTTNAIFDFTTERSRASGVSGGFVGVCFEDDVRVGGGVLAGADVSLPLCAPNATPVALVRPEIKGRLRAARAKAATTLHLRIWRSQGMRGESEVILLCIVTYRNQIRKVLR